jgi:hypothetical protein
VRMNDRPGFFALRSRQISPVATSILRLVALFSVCSVVRLLAFGVVIWSKLYKVAKTWYYHFWLASVVADWLRADMKAVTRKAGIRFRPTPRPPRLFALPCKFVVLSAITISMWSVAMAHHSRHPTPSTWATALQGPLGLLVPSLLLPPKAPDPDPTLDPDPPLDGEGDSKEKSVNPGEDPSPEAMNELQTFTYLLASIPALVAHLVPTANRLTNGLTLTLMLLRVTSPLGALLSVRWVFCQEKRI